MIWLQEKFGQLALAVVAALLVAMSALLFLRANSFNETFSAIRGEVRKSREFVPPKTEEIGKAVAALDDGPVWSTAKNPLFVSQQYVVRDGQLINLGKSGGPEIHAGVPNDWLRENDLDILDPNVMADDSDGDGFDNLNEFKNRTNPRDKNSHAGYYTALRLKQFKQKPFRLIFMARPDPDSFQINVIDVRGQPTQYRKVGEDIEGTKFKVVAFEEKIAKSEDGIEKDVSELTVQNTETGEKVVLIKERTANSPDSFAVFSYLWDKSEFTVKKDGNFSLKPDEATQYKLIDITADQAVIESVQSGEKFTIPKLDAPAGQ